MISIFAIPVEKIVALAMRDLHCFDGLHTFNFKDGVNTIVGRNRSGKSGLVYALTNSFVFDDKNKNWFNHYFYKNPESLMEIVFIFSSKEHYLRRVISSGATTDLHLYIGDGEDRVFLRDGEVVEYFRQCKLDQVFDIFDNEFDPRAPFSPSIKKNYMIENIMIANKQSLEILNLLLARFENRIEKVVKRDGNTLVIYKDGRLSLPLEHLSMKDALLISILSVLSNHITKHQKTYGGVIVLDDFELGLDKNGIEQFNQIFEYLSHEYGVQIFITSRSKRNRSHAINLRKLIPVSPNYTIKSNTVYKKAFKSNVIVKNPPYIKKFRW